jgi:hypothetical protein
VSEDVAFCVGPQWSRRDPTLPWRPCQRVHGATALQVQLNGTGAPGAWGGEGGAPGGEC